MLVLVHHPRPQPGRTDANHVDKAMFPPSVSRQHLGVQRQPVGRIRLWSGAGERSCPRPDSALGWLPRSLTQPLHHGRSHGSFDLIGISDDDQQVASSAHADIEDLPRYDVLMESVNGEHHGRSLQALEA